LHHDFHVHVHGSAVKRVVVPLIASVARRVVVEPLVHLIASDFIVIVQQHHFLVLVLSLVVITVGHTVVQVIVLIVTVSTIVCQLFEFICVCRSDELTVHVKDLTLRVHQEFSIISFNLNAPHYDIVLHVHANLLVSLTGLAFSLPRLSIEAVVDVHLVFIESTL